MDTGLVQECGLCGERFRINRHGYYDEEVGEFWDAENNVSVIAHADCGFNAGFDLA